MNHTKYINLSQSIEIIYRIENALKNAINFNETLDIALDMIMNETDAESGTIWIVSEDRSYLTPYVIKGEKVSALKEFILPMGAGITGWVAENNRPEMIADCRKDSRFSESADNISNYLTKTMICVPISTKNNILGVVQLINKKNDELFEEKDMELCLCFATLIAVYLEMNGISAKIHDRKPIIKLVNISKAYDQGKIRNTVLKNINLTIYEHELLIILGSSGAGKSTLLNILGGMDSATEGAILVDGADYSNPLPRERALYRRDKVGFIFQSYNLISNLTAYENIRIALEIAKLPTEGIDDVLEWVGLSARKNHFPHQMSGGEQQRVSIARALAKAPDIILADEPTGALDDSNGWEILKLLEKISREKKGTVVIITHNTSYSQIADRVIKIKDGALSEITYNPYPVSVEKMERNR